MNSPRHAPRVRPALTRFPADFIGRWLHLAPDNGSGLTEALFLLAAVALIAAVACRRRIGEYLKRRG